MRKMITSNEAPEAIGCYSQAILTSSTLYLSGQIGIDPKTGALVSEDFSAQLHQIMRNIKNVLAAANAGLHHVVKIVVYLKSFEHFPLLNQIMPDYFAAPYPARSTVGVASLPKDALVEVEATAHVD